MRLTEDEFWRLTPKRYVALSRVHERLLERADWRAGMIAAVIVNSAPFVKRKKTYQPADFMPGGRVQSDAAVQQKALAFAKTFGFEVKTEEADDS